MSLIPSAEEATPCQLALGRAVRRQAAPPFVEVQTPPGIAHATCFRPSAEDATENQSAFGASLSTQSCAEESGARPSRRAAATSRTRVIPLEFERNRRSRTERDLLASGPVRWRPEQTLLR